MDDLQSYANLAEILSGIAVVFGFAFGLIEYRRYKALERKEAAASLARSFQTIELAAAIRLLMELPEPFNGEEYKKLSRTEKDQLWLLFCSIESIGILIHRGELPLDLVDEFFSLPIVEGWRKLAPYINELREDLEGPQAWEWYQWLAERMIQSRQSSERVPAYIKHRN